MGNFLATMGFNYEKWRFNGIEATNIIIIIIIIIIIVIIIVIIIIVIIIIIIVQLVLLPLNVQYCSDKISAENNRIFML